MSNDFKALWPDEKWDRELASNGSSRYAAYLHVSRFGGATDEGPTMDPAEFAAAAVLTALSPVMSPGYLLTHPRVLDVVQRWDDDGRLAFAVTVAFMLPRALNREFCARWQSWHIDRRRGTRWIEPWDNDRPAVLPSIELRVPVAADLLPVPKYSGGYADVAAAKQAVAVVCREVNRNVAPLLAFVAAGVEAC
ncbi:hypothetical protein [Lentzea nigeriaca]|uniref:hypothetical protein n=1 Tax=Lentzea nigeriaca TaxID=1128665 RepID=UPI001959B3E0|nr:hypothetical protein [Lentzea nigeriaca]MBM7861895.1 hypothetical protein [Lentzea nigeriaca]